jgi:hypothetical protein
VRISFAFGLLGELDDDALRSSRRDSWERNTLNAFSELLFYFYATVSQVIILNLLIAIVGDSYDKVIVHQVR